MKTFMTPKIKIAFSGTLVLLAGFLLNPAGNAASSTSSGAVNIAASIPSGLTLNVTIVDQVTQSVVPTMNFGELERVGDEFRAAKFFKVLLEVDTVGDPLHVTQVGSALARAGGSETIPSGAYIAEPTYSESDNEGKPQPAGANLDARRSVVGTNEIYSDTSGAKRFISVFYRLSGDPATGGTAAIPLDQKSGSYSGMIQYTLTSD